MPFEPGDTIRKAVDRLLASDNGFVVFDDGNDDEYVQYSHDPDGLTLFWPAHGPRVPSTQGSVASLLQSFDFRQGKDVKKMTAGTYVVESDGLYAQFGRNVDLVENFTAAAFERVYGRLGVEKLNTRLET
jgi:hypothetical protein